MDSVVNNLIVNQIQGVNPISYHTVETIDPFANFRGKEIIGLLNIINLPSAQIDRSLDFACFYDSTFFKTNLRYNNFPETPIGINIINKSYNNSNGEFSITFNAISSQTIYGNYFAQLIIYEDNLIYPQAVGICGGGANFVHNFVAREISNQEVFGDTLISGSWLENQLIQKTFSTTIKSVWIPENCKFIIVIYKLLNPTTLVHSEVQQSYSGNVTGNVGIKNANSFVKDYYLSQNFPNPFNPKTNIKFSIPKNTFVQLKIYDILGKEIVTLCKQFLQRGIYNVEFDIQHVGASSLPSGTYFYTLRTSEFTSSKRMTLIK